MCVNGSEYKGKTKPSLPTLGINGKEVFKEKAAWNSYLVDVAEFK